MERAGPPRARGHFPRRFVLVIRLFRLFCRCLKSFNALPVDRLPTGTTKSVRSANSGASPSFCSPVRHLLGAMLVFVIRIQY